MASHAGATREAGEPSHGPAGDQASVWWTWTAGFSGTAAISLGGSSESLHLAAYRGDRLDRLDLLARSLDPRDPAVAIPCRPGDVVQIAVAAPMGTAVPGSAMIALWLSAHPDGSPP